MKWLWKITQAPRYPHLVPIRIQYFIDPYRVIQSNDNGGLHPSNSKIDSLELGVVWHYIMGKNLNEKHDSLADMKAQSGIILHADFVRYINTNKSVELDLGSGCPHYLCCYCYAYLIRYWKAGAEEVCRQEPRTSRLPDRPRNVSYQLCY